ncbi:primosomal protein N' [Pusillimonas sp. CC-YST705]|uniref:Replication restart protein PriA n=1 Tax=Mesopusillimonas faecipullorum TaxID=2755040 RepID=A0ABS8CCE9_9BURK|nr:primosomal protein N' [Mesopusillimonas faecipullorum]MCB5363721.1 primosomal protein N' [Mesopusillimonas faecipullorum]
MASSTNSEGELTPDSACTVWVHVALDVPLQGEFVYRSSVPVQPGQRVIVPFGNRRKVVGMAVALFDEPGIAPEQVKEIEQVLDDLPPMPADWLRMAAFAAGYYQRPLGEVMLPVLPASLRKISAYQGERSAGGPVARIDKRKARATPVVPPLAAPRLNVEQQAAVDYLAGLSAFQPVLLHGVTGSGKTEVYLGAMQAVLEQGLQVLLLVPEINLTPQLEQVLRARLASLQAGHELAVLHSRLAEGERLRAWLQAQRGQASVLLGTRLSIFTPMPKLGLIIIDEEHDASYKQQEGLRYSARDLAVWRARDRDIPVLLGSATPSLESWLHVQRANYHKLSLTQRATTVTLPEVQLVDTRRLRLQQGFSPQMLEAIEQRLASGQQSLVFLNRRGYAPVLSCHSCGWLSRCTRCTAYMVMHRQGGPRNELQCHHCGHRSRVPRACPDCGDQDLQPMGRGTQRVEEYLAERFPQARIARIDADSTRRKGSAEALFAQVHAGEVDILVGTQMVAKGHDFAKLGLVGVLNADAMLFAHDFRAPERLFAQLMQVAGRAGRHTQGGAVMIQTDYPEQPVYQALRRHDYDGFADYALHEREEIGLPPYAYQALLTAEARQLAHALDYLQQARDWLASQPELAQAYEAVMLYDPVPLRIVRVANVERAQLLVESVSRPVLQAFLAAWMPVLAQLGTACRVRWQLEVDPQQI